MYYVYSCAGHLTGAIRREFGVWIARDAAMHESVHVELSGAVDRLDCADGRIELIMPISA